MVLISFLKKTIKILLIIIVILIISFPFLGTWKPYENLINKVAFEIQNTNKGVEYGNDAKIYKLNSCFNDDVSGSSGDCIRTYIFDKHIREKELLKKRIIEFLNTSPDEQFTIKNHNYVQYWFYRKSAALPLNAYYTNDKRTKLSSKSNDEIAEAVFDKGVLVFIDIYNK